MWVYCITSLAVSQKKKFRDNGNSLTGEVKHKLMRFVKYLLRISCFLVLKSWQILWKIPAKDFTSVVTLQTGNIKLYKTELHHRFLEFSVTSEKVCQSLEEHLSSTTPLRDHLIIRQRYFFFFFFFSTPLADM